MILHSYVEQVMMMCRIQKLELWFYYFLVISLLMLFMHIHVCFVT